MLMLILNVVYVLLAIGMIFMILMQRGSGAQAGAGFGGGASATVFGARGASNFLSQSTKWMAIAFFGISLFMAWRVTHESAPAAADQQDLGVMAQVPAAPATTTPADATVPAAPASDGTVPAAPAETPAAPADAPARTGQQPATQDQEQAPAPPPSGTGG